MKNYKCLGKSFIFMIQLIILSGCKFEASLDGASKAVPPTSISISNPNQSIEISNETQPIIYVGGVKEGDQIYVYTDPTCAVPSLKASGVASSNVASLQLNQSLLADGEYHFYARTVNSKGESSQCSQVLQTYIVDTSAPVAAQSLVWQEGSTSTVATNHPQWVKSSSSDLASQKILIFNSNNCASQLGSDIVLDQSSSQYNYTATIDGDFTFKIKSIDQAGNESLSVCSSSLAISAMPIAISQFNVPQNKTYTLDDPLYFEIVYTKPVIVTGYPRLSINIGGQTFYADYEAFISDSTHLKFLLQITQDDVLDNDGIQLGASVDLNGGSILDASSNPAPTTLPATNTSGILVYTNPQVNISSQDFHVDENDVGFNSFNVSLSRPADQSITLGIIYSGTATVGVDFTGPNTVTFGVGEQTKAINLDISSDGLSDNREVIVASILSSDKVYMGTKVQQEILVYDGASLGYSQVAVGANHSCSLSAGDGSISCWGKNDYAQLGTGTASAVAPYLVPTPQLVSGVTDAIGVGVGTSHTCFIDINSDVKCFGRNNYGQLGNNSTTASTTPVAPIFGGGMPKVQKLIVSNDVTCVITVTADLNRLLCWGRNQNNSLLAAAASQTTPYEVIASGVQDFSTNGQTSCALLGGGEVRCWGRNSSGQVGVGNTTTPITTPTTILASGAVKVHVADSSRACYILNITKELKCWGNNTYGAVGDGSNIYANVLSPSTVISSNVESIAGAYEHMCASLSSGELKCWGHNYFERMGSVSAESTATPVSVLASGVAQVFAGGNYTCILNNMGDVLCNGNDDTAKYGKQYSEPYVGTPATASLITNLDKLSLGGAKGCYVNSSGVLSCWGANTAGSLGVGGTRSISYPVQVLTDVDKVSVGRGSSACAIMNTTGELKCWGANYYGAIGLGIIDSVRVPKTVVSSGVLSASLGGGHLCYVNSTNQLICTGDDYAGRVGDGAGGGNITVKYTILSNVRKASLGDIHSCALMLDGSVKCWGEAASGKLGNGTTTPNVSAPVDVLNVSNAQDLVSGDSHNCALIAGTGEVKCWGANASGQIGNGGTTAQSTAVSVIASGASQIAAGGSNTCAIMSGSNELKCWGSNGFRQVGNGSSTNATSPVTVIASNVSAVSVGSNLVCAKLSSGSTQCWGGVYSGRQANTDTNWFRFVRGL